MTSFTRRTHKQKRLDTLIFNVEPRQIQGEELENVIDKYLLSILKPLNIALAVFACPKFKIKNGSIVSINTFHVVVLVFGILTSFIIFGFDMIYNEENGWEFITFATLLFGLLLTCFTNITQRRNSVTMIIQIQKVYRLLKINPIKFRCFNICNWICVISIISFALILVTYFIYTHEKINIIASFVHIYISCFDINIFYSAIIMKLLEESLRKWVADVHECFAANLMNDAYLNKMYYTFMGIFEAYQMTETVFRPVVSISSPVLVIVIFLIVALFFHQPVYSIPLSKLKHTFQKHFWFYLQIFFYIIFTFEEGFTTVQWFLEISRTSVNVSSCRDL